MSDTAEAELASYQEKWIARIPEFAVALPFIATPQRATRSALACWIFEIEQAAFAARESEPAAIKLQWWAAEWQQAQAGQARHPLTRVLAHTGALAAISLMDVHAVIVAALGQRNAQPAGDKAALLDGYALFYQPLATIVASVIPIDATATARAFALARAVRETAALPEVLRAGRLPLPLDLLARQRLARGDLAKPSAPRNAALADWMTQIVAGIDTLSSARPRLDVIAATMIAADRSRLRAAMRVGDPIAALESGLSRVPLTATLAAWRSGRRLARTG